MPTIVDSFITSVPAKPSSTITPCCAVARLPLADGTCLGTARFVSHYWWPSSAAERSWLYHYASTINKELWTFDTRKRVILEIDGEHLQIDINRKKICRHIALRFWFFSDMVDAPAYLNSGRLHAILNPQHNSLLCAGTESQKSTYTITNHNWLQGQHLETSQNLVGGFNFNHQSTS